MLAQALSAANKTVATERSIHSLHAYFLRAGFASEPVFYDVENLRDGNSISTRQITGIQRDRPIFTMSASFHIQEPGFSHQCAINGEIPSPEVLLAQKPLSNKVPEHGNRSDATSPFILLPVTEQLFTSALSHEPNASFWFKTRAPLRKDPALHAAALAFVSDLGLLATTVLPHPSTLFSSNLIAASIDHALWFHESDFDINEWMLCQITSPWAGNARGFATANVFDRRGKIIANSAQEGLIRPIDK